MSDKKLLKSLKISEKKIIKNPFKLSDLVLNKLLWKEILKRNLDIHKTY